MVAGDQALLDTCFQLPGLNAPPMVLPSFATPADLRAQHRGSPLVALAEDRPSPAVEELFHWSDGQPPSAAVVVSLFNYFDRITEALNSVAAQTSELLELIVAHAHRVDMLPAS